MRREPTGEKPSNSAQARQKAPEGLKGKAAEAQGGADAPEGGVQAAQGPFFGPAEA